jgi:dipeptidyl aminopeptidase/acylaminoacyl peptidase
MPRLAILATLLLAALLVACGGSKKNDTPSATETPTATAQPTAAEGKPTAEAAVTGVANEPVRFETTDGVAISGHLYSTAGPKRQVVVLAHEYPKDQTAWTAFAQELANRGVDALTFDFRGYGETGGDKDVSKIDLDLEASVRFISSRDYARVYVFGASMGGTAALKVAARLDLAGVVTLSAPTDFMGLDARDDVGNITAPKLFVAARGDDGAPAAVDYFMQHSAQPKLSVVFDASEHGTDLLYGQSGNLLKKQIYDFLDQY